MPTLHDVRLGVELRQGDGRWLWVARLGISHGTAPVLRADPVPDDPDPFGPVEPASRWTGQYRALVDLSWRAW